MAITVDSLVDMYISRSRNLIDDSTDSSRYAADKALAIELALNSYGFVSEAGFPSDNRVGYQEMVALMACGHLLTSLSFAVLDLPIEQVGDANIKASFEARQRNIEKLRGYIEARVLKLEKSLNVQNAVVGPFFGVAKVDTTLEFDAAGDEIDNTSYTLTGDIP